MTTAKCFNDFLSARRDSETKEIKVSTYINKLFISFHLGCSEVTSDNLNFGFTQEKTTLEVRKLQRTVIL